MARVAIIGSEDVFWQFAFSGIRSVVVCVYYALKQAGHEVDFVAIKHERNSSAAGVEYADKPSAEYFFKFEASDEVLYANCHTINKLIDASSVFAFLRSCFANVRNKKADFAYELVATDLSCYDILISSANWYVDAIVKNISPNHKVFCLFHDSLPVVYSFIKRTSQARRFDANRGLQLCFKNNYKIVAVSQQARGQLIDTYRFSPYFNNNLIEDLPQMILPVFYEAAMGNAVREDAVILGNVHAKRKRLDYALKVLVLTQKVKKVYVYGGNTKTKVIWKFMKRLKGKMEIEWYTVAAGTKVIEMYDKGKVLLFPSDFEGIGLPIIEAQVRGCAVLCQERSPMKDLLLDGSKTLSMDPAKDAELLDGMMIQKVDNNEIGRLASDKYNVGAFVNKINSIIQ